jgi:solute carrier family 25 aspartate/glutamate transporter 12/13
MDNVYIGLISGYIGAALVYPIDFVKTHVQNNSSLANIKFKNMYRGSLIQLVGIGPEKAIKLFVNDNLIASEINPILAGACAGFAQVLITNPIEYIKIQYQMNMIQNIKINKIYHGYQLCLLRDIPFSSIYFPTFSYLKSKFDSSFLAGFVAAIPAAYLVTPMDVIKTRMQTNPELFASVTKTIKIIYQKDGFRGFWKGGLWRVCKSSPQFAFTLGFYDMFKNI